MINKRIRNKAWRMRYGYDFPKTGYDVDMEIEEKNNEKKEKERKGKI